MSVFTPIDAAALRVFLADYPLGELKNFAGIHSGITNTNYYLTTERGHYVLTIFEQLTTAELPFFLELTAFLAERGIPCAHPIARRAGGYISRLQAKPASLVECLPGTVLQTPTVAHCANVGATLGRLHRIAREFPSRRANTHGLQWAHMLAEELAATLGSDDLQLIREELDFQAQATRGDLPQGIVHADLFRENVLFEGMAVSGLVDFYFACNEALLLDVAITVNDWCMQSDGALDVLLARSLLRAYQVQRPFTTEEHTAWPRLLRAAALRFWLSRLQDLHFPPQAALTYTKDPDAFKRILERHISGADIARRAMAL